MTAFAGSSLYAEWVYSGGTVVLDTDFRTFSYTPVLSLIDSTAGADSYREFIDGIGEGGDPTFTLVMQTGATVLLTALARNTNGTLNVGVEGTASGKPKLVIPAISKGPQYDVPYDDIVTLTASFQQSAAETSTTW